MPEFKKSKSQKRSQSQSRSKNGGRRRKHTMRKLRRMKKSRKVMRGGGAKEISSEQLAKQLNTDGVMPAFLDRYFKVQEVPDKKFPGFDDFKEHYNQRFNQNNSETLGKFDSDELQQRLSLNQGQKGYENTPTTNKLQQAILTLAV